MAEEAVVAEAEAQEATGAESQDESTEASSAAPAEEQAGAEAVNEEVVSTAGEVDQTPSGLAAISDDDLFEDPRVKQKLDSARQSGTDSAKASGFREARELHKKEITTGSLQQDLSQNLVKDDQGNVSLDPKAAERAAGVAYSAGSALFFEQLHEMVGSETSLKEGTPAAVSLNEVAAKVTGGQAPLSDYVVALLEVFADSRKESNKDSIVKEYVAEQKKKAKDDSAVRAQQEAEGKTSPRPSSTTGSSTSVSTDRDILDSGDTNLTDRAAAFAREHPDAAGLFPHLIPKK